MIIIATFLLYGKPIEKRNIFLQVITISMVDRYNFDILIDEILISNFFNGIFQFIFPYHSTRLSSISINRFYTSDLKYSWTTDTIFPAKIRKTKKVGQTIFSLNLDGTFIARYAFKAIPKTKRKNVSYLCKDADEALGFAAESQLIDQLVARNY